jgi:hypothetical protein
MEETDTAMRRSRRPHAQIVELMMLRVGGALMVLEGMWVAIAGIRRTAAYAVLGAIELALGVLCFVVAHILAKRFDDPGRRLTDDLLTRLPPSLRSRESYVTLILADRSVIPKARVVGGCVMGVNDSPDLGFKAADVLEVYPYKVLLAVAGALAAFNPLESDEAARDQLWYADETSTLFQRLERGANVQATKAAIESVFIERWPDAWNAGLTDREFGVRWTQAAERIAALLATGLSS